MSRPETPLLTVDIIIELTYETGKILLIERKNPPYGWALPGGFVDIGETLENAAIREAKEETCLEINLMGLLGCYSDPARDKRGHTVSAVYMAESGGKPQADDDAKNLDIFSLDDLPDQIVFDHRKIIDDYRRYLETGKIPTPGN